MTRAPFPRNQVSRLKIQVSALCRRRPIASRLRRSTFLSRPSLWEHRCCRARWMRRRPRQRALKALVRTVERAQELAEAMAPAAAEVSAMGWTLGPMAAAICPAPVSRCRSNFAKAWRSTQPRRCARAPRARSPSSAWCSRAACARTFASSMPSTRHSAWIRRRSRRLGSGGFVLECVSDSRCRYG